MTTVSQDCETFARFDRGKILVPSCRFQIIFGTPLLDLRQLASDLRKLLKFSAVWPLPTAKGGMLFPRK